ncbi:uncharacterized protein LOC111084201, partial [Limulus polyphemus]|uniref:Uncharacterized protein LOC111084201 n=1 Tax=Limulus polyphemus TaxID=6850 RepID=A0ABM1RZ76_LIMPO
MEYQNKLYSGSSEGSAALSLGQCDQPSSMSQPDVIKAPEEDVSLDLDSRETESSSCHDDVETRVKESGPSGSNVDVETRVKESGPSGSNGDVETRVKESGPSGSNVDVETRVKESGPSGSNGDVETRVKESENHKLFKSINMTSITKDEKLEGEVVGDSKGLAATFQAECVYHAVKDAMEEFKDSIHKDLFNLHMEIVRQLHEQM